MFALLVLSDPDLELKVEERAAGGGGVLALLVSLPSAIFFNMLPGPSHRSVISCTQDHLSFRNATPRDYHCIMCQIAEIALFLIILLQLCQRVEISSTGFTGDQT